MLQKIKYRIKNEIFNYKYSIPKYKPKNLSRPENLIDIPTAWKGLESVIEDIIYQFDLDKDKCIEFGVEFGYSSVVFSNFFEKVVGVDLFLGDIHTRQKGDHFESTKKSLKNFSNIHLFKADYNDWIQKDEEMYDLAHVDIVHTYEDTFKCGLWAVQHSKCTLFHDTESFKEVRRAVVDIAKNSGKKVYNYPYHNGLGVIV